MASIVLDGFAIPFPAISKAVPWSGEVLIMLIPAVKFTPVVKDFILRGIRPWSWYMANIPSKSPFAISSEKSVGRERPDGIYLH